MGKLLSLVIVSRNDSYMGDSNWRLAVTLDFLASELVSLGRLDDMEVLVVDWGSPVPLHQVVAISPAVQRITRFLLVPPGHPALGMDLAGALPWNVGYRRARGAFIAQSGNDILWPREMFRNLLPLLQGDPPPARRTLLSIRRRHVPWEVVSRRPPVAGLRSFLREHGSRLPSDPIGRLCLSPSGTLLMHRDLWLAARGCDESYRHWAYSDVDLVFRMRLRHRACDFGEGEGRCLYHLQHNPPGAPLRRIVRDNPLHYGPFTANGPGWGLGDERLQEYPPVDPADVSALRGGDDRPAGHYRLRHLANIARFSFPHSPREAANALFLFLGDLIPFPPLRRALGRMRLPSFLKRRPVWARRIRGPWDRGGGG